MVAIRRPPSPATEPAYTSPYTSLYATPYTPPSVSQESPLSEFNAPAILAEIRELNERLGRYFTSILSTLTYRDSQDRYWYISRVEVNDTEFEFFLADDDGRKHPAHPRRQIPYHSNAVHEVLITNLRRISICDGNNSSWTSLTLDEAIPVEGGYLLLVEEH
jgi:hypothetical protein